MSADPSLLPLPNSTYGKAQNSQHGLAEMVHLSSSGPSNSQSIEEYFPGIIFKLIGSGTVHQLNSGPRWQEHLCNPYFPFHCSSNGLDSPVVRGTCGGAIWWQGQRQFKRRDNDPCIFFPKPRGRESAVLACCQDSSLKTYQFFLINKIRPQAVYKGRMCNNY